MKERLDFYREAVLTLMGKQADDNFNLIANALENAYSGGADVGYAEGVQDGRGDGHEEGFAEGYASASFQNDEQPDMAWDDFIEDERYEAAARMKQRIG